MALDPVSWATPMMFSKLNLGVNWKIRSDHPWRFLQRHPNIPFPPQFLFNYAWCFDKAILWWFSNIRKCKLISMNCCYRKIRSLISVRNQGYNVLVVVCIRLFLCLHCLFRNILWQNWKTIAITKSWFCRCIVHNQTLTQKKKVDKSLSLGPDVLSRDMLSV